MDHGARKVFVGATHAVLAGPAAERLSAAPIEQVLVTDTIPVDAAKAATIGKLKVLGMAELIGEAIHRIHNDESVSSLFLKDAGQ
jgi:ribose-phosphate pyrophosphokinase